MILASMESFIGSVWFGAVTFFVGYLLGHVFQLSRLFEVFKKK